MYNKHSLGNWGPFVSIADRVEALFEHAKRVSLPEPCLTGGGTKRSQIAVNAFIHGGVLSDPIELNPNIYQKNLASPVEFP